MKIVSPGQPMKTQEQIEKLLAQVEDELAMFRQLKASDQAIEVQESRVNTLRWVLNSDEN